jgi:cytoskeleton protein RodZ
LNESVQNPADAVSDLPAAVSGVSVGEQLQVAREAAKISLDEVAQALKFSPRQIEALEADDCAALPGVTIVRGFVRSYARFLKLDADVLLSQLDAAMPNAPAEVRPPDNMGIASQPRGLREFSPVVSVALVLLLAAILLVLWHFFGPSAPKATIVAGQAIEPPQQVQPAQESPSATNPLPASPVAPMVASPADGVMPPVTVVSAETAVPALRFAFADRSWVEVTDANRQLLHSGENPGGSQLVLNGKPPFDIVIGNAGKVTLTYGERVIDLAPHMRAEVARLTVE